MPIELDKKEGNYGYKRNKKEKYKATKEPYGDSDLFEKIVHVEIDDDSVTTYLAFKKSGDSRNKLYNFSEHRRLRKVEIFFSIFNENNPLVLGIDVGVQKYYTFSYLNGIKVWTSLNTQGRQFPADQLIDKLIEENNNQNKVITYRLDKKPGDGSYDGVEVKSIEHPSFDKYQHTAQHGFGDRTSYLLYKGKQLQLSGQSYSGSGPELKPIQKKCYCEIFVWYFKPSNSHETNPPNYLELKEKNVQNSEHTYYLERSDHVGKFWTQIEDPKLENVITYLLDKRHLDSQKYNNSIEVTKLSNGSFEFYTHKPDREYANKKGILRYNDKDLQLVPNDHLGAEITRLDKFNGHPYCIVILYYYNATGQNQKPEFLQLIEKNGIGDSSSEIQDSTNSSNCYLFQIADTDGVKWTQIEYQDLKETITFQLEWKKTNEYNECVRVTNRADQQFEIYSHTPKENHKNKSGLLLFNWRMLTLQPNDGLSTSTTILKKLQGKKYCKVDLYYTSFFSQFPVFIRLSENQCDNGLCESNGVEETETNFKCYWLERLDNNALHWKQIKKPENLYSEATQLVSTILNNDKNSIVVKLTEKDWYSMKTLKHYVTNGIGIPTNPQKGISVKLKVISGSPYRYYEHSFSQSNELLSLNIERLRTFIENSEINLLGTGNINQNLLFSPIQHTNDTVCVYFTVSDNIPLLLYYRNEWYGPNKKEDYLERWNVINELQSDQPTSDSNSKITQELDKINKRLNEIDLSKISDKGYGITKPKQNDGEEYYKSDNGKFDGKRVTVTLVCVDQKFRKITHSTKNNSSIGKVLLGMKELENDKGDKLSQVISEENELRSATVISVIAYYHRTDSGYTKPLLLGFVKTGIRNIPEVFYERQSVNDDSRWAKIKGITDLRGDDGIAKRVDKIRYDIGTSVKIRMYQQAVESGSDKYQVQLVPNTNGGRDPGPLGSGQNIQISKGDCAMASSAGYKCFTHQIPDNISTNSSEYVSGLKLYVCQNHYLSTHDKGNSALLPIYYDPNKNQVKVYFYCNGGTRRENPDKVPLLAEYNGNHYKPSSRDEYFTRWDKVEVSATDQVTTVGPKTLQKVLDEINKELNTIELDTTGSTGGYKYGIKKPDSEAGNCGSDTKIDEFCNRVSVEQAYNNYYKKVIHSTMNKGPIGSVVFRGKKIDGFNSPRLAAKCNKVEVYYHTSDSSYTKPLLIHIAYQNNDIFCNNWYYRWNLDGTQWKQDTHRKYDSNDTIRDQLNLINTSMSNFLYLQIDKQDQYQILAKSGSETEGREHKGYIGIDKFQACSSYDPGKNYRCFKHQMADYYSQNKSAIKDTPETQDQPTLEVKITIVDHKLNLVDSQGSPLPSQLTYGPTEERSNSNPYVYFFEPSGETDKVPLLFMFSQKCFVPESKENYFTRWKKVEIDFVKRGQDPDPKENIKIELNRITRMLNVINLDTTTGTGYGDIEPPGDRSQNPLGAEKRVSVTKHRDTDYNSVTHSTANTGCVGAVKHGGRELEIVADQSVSSTKWSEKMEAELNYKTKADIYNELTVYYHKSDSACKNPLLIKISGSSGGSHARVEDLYYERAEKEDNWKWKKVTLKESLEFTHVDRLTDKINRIFDSDNSVAIQLGPSPSDNQYELNVVRNGGQETDSSDPKNGHTTSSLNPDHLSTSSIPSHQHSVSTDGSGEQLPGPGSPGEHVTQEPHLKQQEQESRVQGDRGESSGSPTDQETTGVEGPGDSVSEGTGLAPGAPKAPGLDGKGLGTGQELGRSSSMSGAPGGSGAENSTGDGFFETITKIASEKPALFYGSTGGSVAGVGLMATVGGVVYKKCIVGSAVAAGKAAAKVAASAASGM